MMISLECPKTFAPNSHERIFTILTNVSAGGIYSNCHLYKKFRLFVLQIAKLSKTKVNLKSIPVSSNEVRNRSLILTLNLSQIQNLPQNVFSKIFFFEN